MESNVGLTAKDGGGAIPLVGVEVGGEVLGSHARVLVRQKYRNTETKPVEAVYTFPLSSGSTLVGFRMTVAGREVVGVVKEREEAFQAYDDAITAGHGAALVEQERPNVFTASVGNLLPGEETIIEIEYLERVQADEGALRLMIPTLVAPRYIPGGASGDRTAHGWADPTDRVPDADRITPPLSRDVAYGITLDLVFDLGHELEIESPSHAILVQDVDRKQRVRFKNELTALDRDIVLIARGLDDAKTLTTLAMHKGADAAYFALTVVPDLAGIGRRAPRQDVVFLIDISGSMGGSSLVEAQAALRLCLRHLREGDRFNVIAFDDRIERFAKKPVPFTQKTLEDADRWVAALEARGGTEILAPLMAAAKEVPDGVIVLLTDGQVGNEAEILEKVLAARDHARIYSFGIGTNVSDWMLKELAKKSGGAVELIHPGERIDEKVVAQFARAVAARVEEVKLEFPGLDVGERAPSETAALVDGEPWAVFGRIERGQSGTCRLRGRLDGKPFELDVPIDVREAGERPVVAKLWAGERIKDLESQKVEGRRADSMKTRIVKLAIEHGIMCSHTSFVVVETRTGDRRANGQPETRVVPVALPAGWDMFGKKDEQKPMPAPMMTRAGSISHAYAAQGFGGAGGAPGGPPRAMPPAPPAASAPMAPSKSRGILGRAADALAGITAKKAANSSFRRRQEADLDDGAPAAEMNAPAEPNADPVMAILERQLASGLWDENDSIADDDVRRARATARALLELIDLGVTSAHPLHGAQIKKAVEALLSAAPALAARDKKVAELALGVAWLAASGRRTRRQIEDEVGKTAVTLRVWLADAEALKAHLEQLSA
jgi:Ca-activated chloride channel family protein